MDESADRNNSEPEIRLVDLLATIIRHRAWVLWTTGVGTLAAVLVLFLLPAVGISLVGGQTLTLQATLRTVTIPAEAQSLVNFDVGAIIQAQRSNLQLVAEVYRATLMTSREATLAKPAFNRVVRTLIDRSFRAVPDPASATVSLTLKAKEQDEERAIQFLQRFVADSRADLSIYAKTQTEQAIANLQMSSKPTTELALQSQARYEVAAKALKGVLADPNFPLALVGGIEAMQDEPGMPRGMTLFLWVIASVCVGALFAFAAEFVSQTRRNTATVELLKKAWRGE